MRLFGVPASDVYVEARRIAEADMLDRIDKLNSAMTLVKDARVSMEAALVKITAAHVDLVLERGESLDDEIHDSFMNNIEDKMWEATENVENYDVYSPSKFFHVHKPSFEAEENENKDGVFAREEGVERTAEVAANYVKETFGKSSVAGETAEEVVYEVNREEIDVLKSEEGEGDNGESRGEEYVKPKVVHKAFYVKGEVFQSMPGVEQLSGRLRQVKDFIKFKVPGHSHIKNGVGDSVPFKQYDYVVMSCEDSGPLTKHNRIKIPGAICREEKYGAFNREELNFLFKHMDDKLNLERQFGGLKHVRNLAKLKLSGDAYINRCYGSIAEYMDFLNEHKYSGKYKVVGAGGVGLKCLLEQLYGGVSQTEVPDGHMLIEYTVYINRYKADVLLHSQGFNDKEFMHYEKCENVFRQAYIERCAGGIVLVTKCGFNKKGVGGRNLLVQYAYIVRSYENIVPLVKHGKFKVSGAVCLEEKHRAFNREEFNILLKHTIDKLKFSGTDYAKIFIGGFGPFAKPVHTSKVGRLKDIYPRIQKKEGDRA